jgi:hypothetical protein
MLDFHVGCEAVEAAHSRAFEGLASNREERRLVTGLLAVY